MSRENRKPEAFRLDTPGIDMQHDDSLDQLDPVQDDAHQAVEAIVHPPRRGFRWGRLAIAAAGALISLGLALSVDALVRDLFARADWLGWAALALAGVLCLALCGLIGREILGIARLKAIAKLRLAADDAAETDDRQAALQVNGEIIRLYKDRPDLASARKALSAHGREIIDGRDLLVLAESEIVKGLDGKARALISSSAKRVSVVTAISPRALVDVTYVLWECIRLIRRISLLYGGRPGALGMVRLTRAVVGHLAVTGTMAVGDTLLHQIVGHGVAARLSARLGEGVVNGLMTARIGLSAMDVCRPLPYLKSERPRLRDLTSELVSLGEKAEKAQPAAKKSPKE